MTNSKRLIFNLNIYSLRFHKVFFIIFNPHLTPYFPGSFYSYRTFLLLFPCPTFNDPLSIITGGNINVGRRLFSWIWTTYQWLQHWWEMISISQQSLMVSNLMMSSSPSYVGVMEWTHVVPLTIAAVSSWVQWPRQSRCQKCTALHTILWDRSSLLSPSKKFTKFWRKLKRCLIQGK